MDLENGQALRADIADRLDEVVAEMAVDEEGDDTVRLCVVCVERLSIEIRTIVDGNCIVVVVTVDQIVGVLGCGLMRVVRLHCPCRVFCGVFVVVRPSHQNSSPVSRKRAQANCPRFGNSFRTRRSLKTLSVCAVERMSLSVATS